VEPFLSSARLGVEAGQRISSQQQSRYITSTPIHFSGTFLFSSSLGGRVARAGVLGTEIKHRLIFGPGFI